MFCQGECCGFAEDPVPKGGYGFTTDDIFYLEVSSEVIRGHQRSSEATRGHQRPSPSFHSISLGGTHAGVYLQ